MQQILYEQSPYIVTDYRPDFEAYNTAKWEGYIAIPDPNGNTLVPPFGNGGYANFLTIEPKTAAAAEGSGGSADVTVIVIVAAWSSSSPSWSCSLAPPEGDGGMPPHGPRQCSPRSRPPPRSPHAARAAADGGAGVGAGRGRRRRVVVPGGVRQAHGALRHDVRRRQPQPVHRVLGPAYEIYHLNYDMLAGYEPNGDVAPEIADELERVPGRPDLDVQDPPRRQVAGRRAAHRQGRRLHLQLHHRERPLGVLDLHRQHQEGVAVDDPPSSSTCSKPKANMLRAVDPDRAGAHLEQGLRQAASARTSRTTRRSSAPGRSRPSSSRRATTSRMVANKDYWEGRAQDRRGRLRDLHQPGHHDDGPQGGGLDCAPRRARRRSSTRSRASPGSPPTPPTRYLVELGVNCYDDAELAWATRSCRT